VRTAARRVLRINERLPTRTWKVLTRRFDRIWHRLTQTPRHVHRHVKMTDLLMRHHLHPHVKRTQRVQHTTEAIMLGSVASGVRVLEVTCSGLLAVIVVALLIVESEM
jgi:hypothetical protein